MGTGALAFAIAVLQALPGLIAAGVQLEQFVVQQVELLRSMMATGRDPTAAEWSALIDVINGDTKALLALAPSPGKDSGNG